jgi:hypothetical protein
VVCSNYALLGIVLYSVFLFEGIFLAEGQVMGQNSLPRRLRVVERPMVLDGRSPDNPSAIARDVRVIQS